MLAAGKEQAREEARVEVQRPLVLSNPFRSPIDDKHEFLFDVAFGMDQVLDGEPIVPALTQLCEFVEGVTNDIEGAILR